MNESQIVGLIIMIFGGLNFVRPDLLLRFQVWSQRIIMGAKYEPSRRTYKIVRFIGVAFIIMGLLAITEIIK